MGSNESKTVAENRRARFDYEISEKFDAGIELLGFEVKSAKAGRMQIAGSYVLIRDGQAQLLNSQIPPYQPKNTPAEYDPGRTRHLLLHKKEIAELTGRLREKFSLIPLRVYLKNGFVKIELGLGKPRKKSDKRDLLKKRTAEREIQRGG